MNRSSILEMLAGYGYMVYSIGHTLFGPERVDFRKQIVLDTSWESPSNLAALDASYVAARISKGWKIFQ